MQLSKPLAGDFVSNYSINFTSYIDIGSNDGCYVKYTFPPEIDAQYLNLNEVFATGMFVQENGDASFIDPETIIH